MNLTELLTLQGEVGGRGGGSVLTFKESKGVT